MTVSGAEVPGAIFALDGEMAMGVTCIVTVEESLPTSMICECTFRRTETDTLSVSPSVAVSGAVYCTSAWLDSKD